MIPRLVLISLHSMFSALSSSPAEHTGIGDGGKGEVWMGGVGRCPSRSCLKQGYKLLSPFPFTVVTFRVPPPHSRL